MSCDQSTESRSTTRRLNQTLPKTRDRSGYPRQRRYVDWWADGIHFNLRGEDDRACLLVIIGVLRDGTKESVALDDGVHESTPSGYEILARLRDHQASPRVHSWPSATAR